MAHCVTVEYKDGSKYCGESDSGTLHGCGVFVEPSGRGVFEGLWVKGSQLSGVYSWPNGKQYSGDWKGSVRSGLGVETRPDGTKFSGDFSQNTMGPLGVLSLPNHGLYMGMWDVSGVQEGDGVEAYADGGFYRGQYKNGQRGGYGTRTSAGYEGSIADTDGVPNRLKIHQRPSVATMMANNFVQPQGTLSLPRDSITVRPDASKLLDSSMGGSNQGWKQAYEGQWMNDKRCGYGVLKVTNCFTYYGQWRENTRTGHGVLIREGFKEGKRGITREEIKEEGRWENGKLVEMVKNYKVMKTELKQKVEEAHQEAIKAATLARDRALISETKANAAAAKSKVSEQRANEARQHALTASRQVEHTIKISQQTIEEACKIKGSVRITLNGKFYDDFSPSKSHPGAMLDRSASYSYLQMAAESIRSTHDIKGIPMVSSCHNIHQHGTKGFKGDYADSD